MNFIRKNWILILILILGAFLRINFDTFLNGYNYDEYAIVSLAKLNLKEMLIALAKEDYHAPLYYIIIHPFANFENANIILRLLNLLFSLCSIFFAYKIGKNIQNKTTGLILAFLLSINHLEISTTNFIKFYCLNITLTLASFYFLIDYLKNNKNLKVLTIINFLISLSFTFAYAFVFFEYIFLYLSKKKKEVIISFLIATIGFVLYLPILLYQTKIALGAILSVHGAHIDFSLFSTLMFFNDYFSPLLNYSNNIETIEASVLIVHFFQNLKLGSLDLISLISFILFSIIPVGICIYEIYSAYKTGKYVKIIFNIALTYLIFVILITKLKITGFFPIYHYFAGIGFLLVSFLGISKLKKYSKWILIGYLAFCHLIITNSYPPEKRVFKIKLYGNMDKYINQINPKTPIVALDGGRFTKYYYKDKNIIAFDYEQMEATHSRELFKIFFGEDIEGKINRKNAKNIVAPIILNYQNTGKIQECLENNLFKYNEFVMIFNSDNRAFIFSDNQIEKIMKKPYNPNLQNSTLSYQIKQKSQEIIDQFQLSELIQTHCTKLLIDEIEKKYKIKKLEQLTPKNGKYQKTYTSNNFNHSIKDIMSHSVKGWVFVTYQKK